MTFASHADVMNLNEFVPTHLEDATPVDVGKTIFQLSGKFEKENPDEITFREDIRYGLSQHLQLEAMVDQISGGPEIRSGESKFSFLYMPYESKSALPALGINPFVAFPTGKKSEGTDPGAKLILTSTFGETQLHLNYQLRHNAGRKSGERADEILYAFGMSRKLIEKLALIVDVIHQDDNEKSTFKNYVETGLHQETLKGIYLSYGIGKGYGPDSPDWMGNLSLEIEI